MAVVLQVSNFCRVFFPLVLTRFSDNGESARNCHWLRYTSLTQITELRNDSCMFSDLASNCRLLLYNRPRHTKLCRWLLLYPLYLLSEVAIISTDLAELLGSAIGLVLLFPKLPLPVFPSSIHVTWCTVVLALALNLFWP